MDASWAERVMRTGDYVQAHLDAGLEPGELAGVAGLSLHHFHRVFRGMTGESVMGFVRRLRLERAASQLKFARAPVTDVAIASGYGSHEAFTRAFRARFGMAPCEYRSRERKAVEDDCEVSFRVELERTCLALRQLGSYAGCAATWQHLLQWSTSAGITSLASIGLCYDDPDITDQARLRYDACLVVSPEVASTARGPVVPKVVPGGRYAVALHVGGYDTLEETYVALLGRALPHRGLELFDEPVVEVYVDDPETTPPENLRTEIQVRVR